MNGCGNSVDVSLGRYADTCARSSDNDRLRIVQELALGLFQSGVGFGIVGRVVGEQVDDLRGNGRGVFARLFICVSKTHRLTPFVQLCFNCGFIINP